MDSWYKSLYWKYLNLILEHNYLKYFQEAKEKIIFLLLELQLFLPITSNYEHILFIVRNCLN